jgi:hypothetical protein
MVKHQDRKRMVRLRNRWVEIDPRQWDAGMDVRVNVGLGQGTPEDRVMALEKIVAAQMQGMQSGAPFVTWAQIRYSLTKGAELAGFRHPDKFFLPWGVQEEQQRQMQAAQQPPPPDANMALVQVEQMKAQTQMQVEAEKLRLREMEIMLQDDRERDRTARETALKEREIEAKFNVQIRDAELKAQVEQDRMAMDADLRREEAARATPTGGEA